MRGMYAIMARLRLLALALLLVMSSAVQAQQRPEMTVDYVMRRGDTLSDLGERYFRQPGDYVRVQFLNGIARDRRIPVGQVIRIPVSLLRSIPAEARIANFRGTVTVAWRGPPTPATVGQAIGEGAEIATGPNAFARVRLPDGGYVSLPSNSRVRVERLRTVLLTGATDQRFRLEAGRAETRAAPVGPGGAHEVSTPVAVAAVRGTEFRSAWLPGRTAAAISVVEGAVAVQAGGVEEVAAAGEGVAVADGAVLRLPLLPAAGLPDSDLTQVREAVVFHSTEIPGAAGYRGRMATDAGMIDAFAEADSGPDRLLVFEGVPDGDYFVRLTPISREGLEGTASTYAFLRARVGVGGLSASPSGAGRDRAYLFRWEGEGAGPAEYRFQFGREDDEGPPLFDLSGLTEPRVSLTGLQPGGYSWRTRITRYVGGRRIDVWSDRQQLRIGR